MVMGQGRLYDEDARQQAVKVYGHDLLGDERVRPSQEVLGLQELPDKLENFLIFPAEAIELAGTT
ncbi:MAG: hypothetical protein ABIM40_16200 [Pseudomonadota bacterium]